MSGEFDRVSVGFNKYPTLELHVAYGAPGLLDSDYEYTKVVGRIYKRFPARRRRMDARLEGGKIWGTCPIHCSPCTAATKHSTLMMFRSTPCASSSSSAIATSSFSRAPLRGPLLQPRPFAAAIEWRGEWPASRPWPGTWIKALRWCCCSRTCTGSTTVPSWKPVRHREHLQGVAHGYHLAPALQ